MVLYVNSNIKVNKINPVICGKVKKSSNNLRNALVALRKPFTGVRVSSELLRESPQTDQQLEEIQNECRKCCI